MEDAEVVGAVLAGGRSTRMGRDKATVELAGRTMLSRVLDRVEASGFEAIVVGPRRRGVDAEFVDDASGVTGPVAGLLGAMSARPRATILLVGCDQPFLLPETLRRLAATAGDAVVPVDGVRQPLCAAYRPSVRPAVETITASIAASIAAPSLMSVLGAAAVIEIPPRRWSSWGEDGRSWLGLDTPDALAAAAGTWPEPPLTTISP